METERKYNSMLKFILLPIIVFLVMQYQIDAMKAEHSQIYYQEQLKQVHQQVYRLEQDIHIEFQRIREETQHIFHEIDTVQGKKVLIPAATVSYDDQGG